MNPTISNTPKQSFRASNLRTALQLVQEALGDDAVILSTQKLHSGVCIDAIPNPSTHCHKPAVVPTPSLQTLNPQHNIPSPDSSALQDLQQELSLLRQLVEKHSFSNQERAQQERTQLHQKILTTLIDNGFTPRYCQNIVDSLGEQQNFDHALFNASQQIAKDLTTPEQDILDYHGAVALVGPTGVGKTTTIAKLAARFAMRYGRENIGLITSDFYRVAGREQLRIYGKILDIPIHMVNNSHDLEEALLRLHDKRLVLIDTAGVSPRDIKMTQKLNVIQHTHMSLATYLVMSATSQSAVMKQAIDAFRSTQLQGCIITKLDECTQLGHALSVCIEKQLPIAYTSHGQNVPEDLKVVSAHQLVQQALNVQSKIKELSYA